MKGFTRRINLIVVTTGREILQLIQKARVPWPRDEPHVARLALRGEGHGADDLAARHRLAAKAKTGEQPGQRLRLRLARLPRILRQRDQRLAPVAACQVEDRAVDLVGRAPQPLDMFDIEYALRIAGDAHARGPVR